MPDGDEQRNDKQRNEEQVMPETGQSRACAQAAHDTSAVANPTGHHLAPRLPQHIARALKGSGQAGIERPNGTLGPDSANTADSAGVPWAGRDLSTEAGPYHHFTGDVGQGSEPYRDAVEKLVSAQASEADVVRALSSCRLFVPVVAELVTDSAEHSVPVLDPDSAPDLGHNRTGNVAAHGDKEADMALVMLDAPDGRRALPVFSDVERLNRWHRQARPVPVSAPRAALAAVSEGAQLLVLDPAADVTFVLRRPALWALAQQQPWIPSYTDKQLHAHIRTVIAAAVAGTTSTPHSHHGKSISDSTEGRVPQSSALEAAGIYDIEISAGPGVVSVTADGTRIFGGGTGPELTIGLALRSGMGRSELTSLIALVETALAGDTLFAERVDSLRIGVTVAS